MKEKVNLFLSYIEFFHKLHTKYLKRFSNKIQLMSTHINNDIQFDENVENDTIFNKKNDECLLDNEQLINRNNLETCNNTNLKLSIDTSDFNNNDIFEYCESDLNTFSDNSYKSTESKKMKLLPKFIKNGFKKVTDMFIGCNFKETYSTTSDNSELSLEKLSNNNDDNDTTSIKLNDFNEIITREEDVIIEESSVAVVEEQPLPVVEEVPVAVVEEPLPLLEEQPLPVIEEQPLPVIEEPPVAVVEEPHTSALEEPPVAVVEEPLPVIEEQPVAVVEEPHTSALEEIQVAVIEESIN
jgi:hypothetical protein